MSGSVRRFLTLTDAFKHGFDLIWAICRREGLEQAWLQAACGQHLLIGSPLWRWCLFYLCRAVVRILSLCLSLSSINGRLLNDCFKPFINIISWNESRSLQGSWGLALLQSFTPASLCRRLVLTRCLHLMQVEHSSSMNHRWTLSDKEKLQHYCYGI